MALIRIDELALMANETALKAKIAELQSLNARLEGLLQRIESSWEGNASQNYIAMMRQRQGKAVQMVEVLSEFLRYIQEAKSRFSSKDSDSAGRIRGAF